MAVVLEQDAVVLEQDEPVAELEWAACWFLCDSQEDKGDQGQDDTH